MFLSLDFIYLPARDLDAVLPFFVDVLGARLVSKIRAMGTIVGEVRLAENGPRLILAEHLHGRAPVLIYRVADLDEATAALRARGLKKGEAIEIPHGPCYRFELAEWAPFRHLPVGTSRGRPGLRRTDRSIAAAIGKEHYR